MPIIGTPIAADNARPVTWAEAKKHLRLDVDTDQAYVESLIDATTDFAETRLGMTLMQRARTVTFHEGNGEFKLPNGPVIGITSVTDDDDEVITDYDLIHRGIVDSVRVNESFTYPITIVYPAGHASREAIDASIRLAIMQHVATLYENRESVSDRTKLPVPHSLEHFYRLKSRSVGVA